MNPSCLAVPALLLASLCAQAPAQTPLAWHGIELLLPAGWKSEPADEVTLLLPPGWKRDTGTGEAYGLLFDGETTDIDGEDLAETIDAAAEELLAGAARSGAPAAERIGAFAGRTFTYALANDAGKQVELRIQVFAAKDGAAALFALGYPDKLRARQKELQALRDSIAAEGTARPKKRAFGLGQKGAPPAPPAGETGSDAPPSPPDNPLARDGNQPKQGENPSPRGGNAPAGAPQFRRIAGGRELAWHGIAIDVPPGWRTQDGEDGAMLILPPGFGENGVVEELFALCGDGSLTSLEAPDAAEQVAQGLAQVQPGLTPRGAGKAAKFGALAGKTWLFAGGNGQGQEVEARVHAFQTVQGVRALLALGYPQKLRARTAELEAMLGSLRPQAGNEGVAGGDTPRELAGQWVSMSNVNANNGGGRSSQTVLTLGADGSYTYSGETVSTNPNGAAWGSENDAGRWSVQGSTMLFRSQSGQVARYALEKRNHPKNNDPMLVLDGKTFVTATQRAPW